MYGAVIRFYNTIIKLKILESMKEDIIDLITKMVFTDQMSTVVTAMCPMCSREDEMTFVAKLSELQIVRPNLIGLSQYFTLDETSKIKDIFFQQFQNSFEDEDSGDGDVGGSANKI